MIVVGDFDTAHEINPRALFLDAINEHAPEVANHLKETCLTAFQATTKRLQQPIITPQQLQHSATNELTQRLLQWTEQWGLEPHRWAWNNAWTLQAALDLLEIWRDGSKTNELTHAYDTDPEYITDQNDQEVLELRTNHAFAYLVHAHVLENRFWNHEGQPGHVAAWLAEASFVRDTQSIAKAVRNAAKYIGLTHVRKAKPGRKHK